MAEQVPFQSGGPDFLSIDSRAKAEELLQRGVLEKLFLMPLEFGGKDIVENVLYVPRGVAATKSGIDNNLVRPLIAEGKVTQYQAAPEYQGRSFIPIAVRVTAWNPGQFAATIKIWAKLHQRKIGAAWREAVRVGMPGSTVSFFSPEISIRPWSRFFSLVTSLPARPQSALQEPQCRPVASSRTGGGRPVLVRAEAAPKLDDPRGTILESRTRTIVPSFKGSVEDSSLIAAALIGCDYFSSSQLLFLFVVIIVPLVVFFVVPIVVFLFVFILLVVVFDFFPFFIDEVVVFLFVVVLFLVFDVVAVDLFFLVVVLFIVVPVVFRFVLGGDLFGGSIPREQSRGDGRLRPESKTTRRPFRRGRSFGAVKSSLGIPPAKRSRQEHGGGEARD